MIKAHLEQCGITVGGLSAELQLSDESGEIGRTITILYGKLKNGSPFVSLTAIRPSKYQLLLRAHKEGTLDLDDFHVYGEPIVSCEGTSFPQDVVLKVAEMYHIEDPQEFLRLVNEDIADHRP